MARTRRIKFTDRDAFHHVTSRIAGRRMLLADPEVKREMLDALERAAEFSGVKIGAFAIMDNHSQACPNRSPIRDVSICCSETSASGG